MNKVCKISFFSNFQKYGLLLKSMQNYSGLNDSKKRSESMAKKKATYLLPIPYEKKERSVLKKNKKNIKRRLSPQKKHYLCIQT